MLYNQGQGNITEVPFEEHRFQVGDKFCVNNEAIGAYRIVEVE